MDARLQVRWVKLLVRALEAWTKLKASISSSATVAGYCFLEEANHEWLIDDGRQLGERCEQLRPLVAVSRSSLAALSSWW